MKILFVNHQEHRCGIHQFAANIWEAVAKYRTQDWFYVMLNNENQFANAYEAVAPDVVLFNFFPSTMGWLSDPLANSLPNTVGICHEHSQIEALKVKFDKVIFPDPTYESNGNVYSTGRLVPEYTPGPPPEKLTIGTFGFGFGNKGNYRLVDQVQQEFDEAHIRLHMSFAAFGDGDGAQARLWAQECQNRIIKPGITLEIRHNFMPTTLEVLNFLSDHTINAFLYDEMPNRGISSTPDYALAAGRPIAISASSMFNHIKQLPIVVPDHSLKEIIEAGPDILEPLREEWSPKNLAKCYEEIIMS